ncbi:MAG TPA: flagellar motor switch protein FliN [Acidimicrobiia bacterium]|nr:flagellar motor switch protein FliN [Acidimicrobiia bacterium]
MSVITAISRDNQAAIDAASVLEQALDGDILFSVGQPQRASTNDELLPTPDARVVAVVLDGPEPGYIALGVSPRLAAELDRVNPGGDVIALVEPAMRAALATLEQASGVSVSAAALVEIPPETLAGAEGNDVALVALLEGSERLATLVVRIGPDAPAPGEATGPNLQIVGEGDDVVRHEFAPLDGGAAASNGAIAAVGGHALELLSDVELGVTVELGRTRMPVRDLLSITPGAVIELDRAAGSPVDVLVNGTLIARGEVVVVDEEFGIRISEIVGVDGKR